MALLDHEGAMKLDAPITRYLPTLDLAEPLAMPHAPTPDGFRRLPYTKNDANMYAAGGLVTTHREEAEQDAELGPFHRHGWGLGWDLGTYDRRICHILWPPTPESSTIRRWNASSG